MEKDMLPMQRQRKGLLNYSLLIFLSQIYLEYINNYLKGDIHYGNDRMLFITS